MPIDIVIYAVIAAGLVLWLRSLLGTRGEGEKQRPNPFVETEKGLNSAQSQGAALPPQKTISSPPLNREQDMRAGLRQNMSILDQAHQGLLEIGRADRSFDAAHFLSGAQEAFVMIVTAFASGDRETLKNLLDEAVYRLFDSALSGREGAGEQAQVEIHAIRRAEITKAWLSGRKAFITVRFIADETNILKDREGALIYGHPDRVTETIDVWTFCRDTHSRMPGWNVCETKDEDAAQAEHKTVPDISSSL